MATESLPPPTKMATENIQQPTKKIITQEDVLKRFMDSRAKSPPKPEPVKTSGTYVPAAPPKPTGGFEDSPSISKNIFHGVHIPPRFLAYSLRKQENKYFYISNVSKYEGNVNEIASVASKAATEYILSRAMVSPLTATIGPPSFCSNSGLFWGTSFGEKRGSHQYVEAADIHQESVKTKGIII